jgi:DNA-directed RNA polymerase subunit RPC12/RpoP
MSYILVDPDDPRGETILLVTETGIYRNLGIAKDDLMTAAFRDNNFALTLCEVCHSGYVQADQLITEYAYCASCRRAFMTSEWRDGQCPKCGASILPGMEG